VPLQVTLIALALNMIIASTHFRQFATTLYIEHTECCLLCSENYLFHCTCDKCHLEADQPDTTSEEEEEDNDDDCMEFVE